MPIPDLFPGAVDLKTDHFSLQVHKGQLATALLLFNKLGFHEIGESKGSWGQARYLSKTGSIIIQLTELSNGIDPQAHGAHLGLMVNDPATTCYYIQQWSQLAGFTVEVKGTSRGKRFIYFPTLLAGSIELIPNPAVCPECKGARQITYNRHHIIWSSICETCAGSGRNPDYP